MVERSMTSLYALILLSLPSIAMACPNTAGVVFGSILGTLVVVGIGIAILFLVMHKRKKAREDEEKKLGTTSEHTYVNPGFDTSGMYSPTSAKTVDSMEEATTHKEKGFQGYVECREYDSPNKGNIKIEEVVSVAASSARRNLDPEFRKSQQRDVHKPGALHKAGSHGSLDNSFNAMDPETVSVTLESQDIIGLGFNICGNIRDGIFVKEVLNRGPAKESGLIKAGDRILSITISFENMVFEDALTILSYASPYPVKLKLQKEAPNCEDETIGDVHHPLYKSQSMDDIRQINQDGLLGPRRTFSEMKRSGPLPKSVEAGHLKKWKNKKELVNEESSVSETDYAPSSVSNFSIPDLKLDMTDGKDGAEQDGKESGLPTEVQIHIPDADLEKSVSLHEIPTVRVEDVDERKTASDINLTTGDIKIEMDAVTAGEATGDAPTAAADIAVDIPSVTLTQADDVTFPAAELPDVDGKVSTAVEAVENAREQVGIDIRGEVNNHVEEKLETDVNIPAVSVIMESEVVPIAPRRKRTSTGSSDKSEDGEAEDKKVKLDENKNAEVEVDVEVLKEKIALIENDIEDNPGQIDFMDVDLNGEFNEKLSALQTDKSSISDEANEDNEEVVEIEEDQMRAVLRDYFGDQPSLLHQFGMSDPANREDGEQPRNDADAKNGTNTNDLESPDSGVVEEKKGSLSDSPTSSRSSSPERSSRDRKSKSPNIRRKSGGGLAFDITATEFKELPDEIPQEPRGDPKGGIAYYVRIDDQHNPTPSKHKDDSSQPPLVKAPDWEGDDTQTTSYQVETSETNHLDGNKVVKMQKIETIQMSNNGDEGETITEKKSSKITVRTSTGAADDSETPTLISVSVGEAMDDSEA